MTDKKHVWLEYFDEFAYFTKDEVRKDCYPRKMVHPHSVRDSIVLIHGLSDSPGIMLDLARYYHEDLGFNVYMPLLQCHGLKAPHGMRGVALKEWKKNVRFALQTAAADTKRVSIGGLSTGGALAFYFGSLDSLVNHKIYLFSAALSLYGGWFGKLKKYLLRSPLIMLVGRMQLKSLVGLNPYRYDYVPLISARELVVLMDEIVGIRGGARLSYIKERQIFNSWSECDDVVDIALLAQLAHVTSVSGYSSYVVEKKHKVQHACVVLQYAIYGIGAKPTTKPLERANPVFKDMVAALSQFAASQ